MRGAYYLGIDLGTTFSAAAIVRDGRPETVFLGTRTAAIPSVVLLRADGTWLVGEAAERRGATEPDRLAREFKRRFGDPVPIIMGGTPQSPEALTARLLGHVYAGVVEREGGPPDGVVLTHPANWGAYKIDLLRNAVRLAGLDGGGEVRFTTEPEAAAIHYAAGQAIPVGAIVAVYDLGGGTFDAAVLRRTAGAFEVLGEPQGIERLGGIDIDAAVLDHARTVLAPALSSLAPDDPAALAALVGLRRSCVEAKEALSADFDTSFTLVLPSGSTEIRMTRAELEARIRPALDDTVTTLQRAMNSAGVGRGALHSVLLVGGSSRIPLVGQIVAEGIRAPVALDVDPKHAVAGGAAVLATLHARAADETGVLPITPAPPAAAPPAAAPPGPPPPPGPPAAAPPAAAFPPAAAVPPPPPAAPLAPAAAPTAPAGPGHAPPPPFSPAASPAGRGRRRPPVPLLVGGAVAAVAAAVGLVMVLGGDDGGGGIVAGDTTSTTVPATAPPTTTTTTPPTTDTTTTIPAPVEVQRILFESTVDGDTAIWSMAPDGSDPVKIIDTGILDVLPTMSPDRTQVVYLHGDESGFEMRVTAADGSGEPLTILSDVERFERAAWLPDGSGLIVPVGGGLSVLDLASRDVEALPLETPDGPCVHNDPAVSPDGERIAYRCTFDGDVLEDEVYVVELATGTVTRLTDSPGIDTDPWWTPDGELLVFRSDRDGDAELFVMGPDGSGLRKLTDNDRIDQDPVVLPDGRIVYSSHVTGEEVDLFETDLQGGGPFALLSRPGADLVPAG